MQLLTPQSPYQGVSLFLKANECIGKDTPIEKTHANIKIQLDWTQDQSTLAARATRRKK